MFQLLWGQTAADINLKNRQGLTPLALSAQLSRSEVFEPKSEPLLSIRTIFLNFLLLFLNNNTKNSFIKK